MNALGTAKFIATDSPPAHRPSRWALLATLAGIQFTHVLDFVMVMPLGPQLMKDFAIHPSDFGLLVSVYNLAAAVAGLIGAFFLDRFDRKGALLTIYAGFTIGTLACGIVSSYEALLAARILTGTFGGLIQAVIFAIIGDCFPEEERGAATGTVMSAFSVASVIGVPAGLFFAADLGWRSPFIILAAISAAFMFTAVRTMPPLRQHLAASLMPGKGAVRALLFERNSIVAFFLIISLMFAGFSVIPYISAYLVANVGLRQSDLATVFFTGGLATLVTSRAIGRLSDNFGKRKVFTWLAALSTLPILMLTNLPHVPIIGAVFVTTLFTVLISARAIPALALITSSVDRARRGSFLSLTSSVQQASSGLASLLAGMLLGLGPHGELTRYGVAGLVAVVATVLSIIAARELKLETVSKR